MKILITSWLLKQKKKMADSAGRFLYRLLPNRTKRMIVLASVFAAIEDIRDPDKRILAQLNTLFKLARVESAIAFPMMISSFVWREVKTTHDLSEFRNCPDRKFARVRANLFLNKIPSWLVYSNQQVIRRDLEQLLQSIDSIAMPRVA